MILCLQSAGAFPPAPGFTIAGNARNQFGWMLGVDSEAVVIVKQNGVKVAEALVGSPLLATQNFEVTIPMDNRIADAYTKLAFPPGVQFTLEVRMGGTVYPIMDLKVTEKLVAEVGGRVNVDFSIAEDLDEDGIPDMWELWQIGESGIQILEPDSLYDVFSRDGDFDGDGTSDYFEYIAGTFAFLSEDSLKLKIESISDRVTFKTFVVVEKKYQLEASTDLKTWVRIPMRIAGATESRTVYTAKDTQQITLETDRVGADDKRIFRLKVQ